METKKFNIDEKIDEYIYLIQEHEYDKARKVLDEICDAGYSKQLEHAVDDYLHFVVGNIEID